MIIERATGPSNELSELFAAALASVRHQRGGGAYLESLGVDDDSLNAWLAGESIWVASDGALQGFAVCARGVISGVFVVEAQRRRGIARALVSEIIRASSPVDAYALPGDRAMKSLYESLGWKARLLTMRAE